MPSGTISLLSSYRKLYSMVEVSGNMAELRQYTVRLLFRECTNRLSDSELRHRYEDAQAAGQRWRTLAWQHPRAGVPTLMALGKIQRPVLAACLLLAGQSAAHAQDIEPRAYSNAPVGINFLVLGYAYTEDGFALDPSLPVKDPQIETSNAVLGYARVIDLWGKSAKFNMILPNTWLSG